MVLIECLSQQIAMLENQLLDSSQVVRSHASVASQQNGWFQPEFALAIWSANMYVCRLLSFIGIEVKPE
jgi:hypothetical protein